MIKVTIGAAASIALFTLLMPLAHADSTDLYGQTVTVSTLFGADDTYIITPDSAIIGDGAEFSMQNGQELVDFGHDTLTISMTVDGGWSGLGDFTFSFPDLTAPIESVTLASNGGNFAAPLTDPIFTANSITLQFDDGGDGPTNLNGGTLVFDIVAPGQSSVPDNASTLMLLGAALLTGMLVFRGKAAGEMA